MSVYGLRKRKHSMISSFRAWSPNCLLNFPKKEKSVWLWQKIPISFIHLAWCYIPSIAYGWTAERKPSSVFPGWLHHPRGDACGGRQGWSPQGSPGRRLSERARAGGTAGLRAATRAHGGGHYALHRTGTQPGSTERETRPSDQEGTAHNVTQCRSQLKGSWAGSEMGRKDPCHLQRRGGQGEISEQTLFILAQSFWCFSIFERCLLKEIWL